MSNSKKCIVRLGCENVTILVFMTKNKMNVNIVYSMKTETHTSTVYVKMKLFRWLNVASKQKQRRFREIRGASSFITKLSRRFPITCQIK